MSTFLEWEERHGLTSAQATFGTTSHLILNITPGKHVVGKCGNWTASMPLGGGEDVEIQIQRIRDELANSFETEEIKWHDPCPPYGLPNLNLL